MKNENGISPAVQLYRVAVQNEGFQQGRSNIRSFHSSQDIVNYAIRYGLRFFIDDFSEIPFGGEGDYAIACGSEREFENRSACLAIEKYLDRKPFLLRDPDKKTPDRMYYGRWFIWFGGDHLLCTSFNDKKKYFTACKYKNGRCRKYGEHPERVFKITHEDIKKFHKMLDENSSLIKEGK